MQVVDSCEALEALKKIEPAVLILFGGEHCQVCHTIKPKLIEFMAQRFPKLRLVYVDCHQNTECCAQAGVFSLPTVQVFLEGQCVLEEVRTFSLTKVAENLSRPYQILFNS